MTLKKYFFEHKYELDRFLNYLSNLELKKHEHKYLHDLARSTVHHRVLDFVLTNLEEEEKKREFLSLLNDDPDHEEVFIYLREEIFEFDEKLNKRVIKYEETLLAEFE